MSDLLHTVALFVLTFVCGAAYECGCVFWVHYSEQGRARPAVVWSCFNALVTVVGIETFLRSWLFVVAYVLGFGTGTYLAIRIKNWLRTKPLSAATWKQSQDEADRIWRGR